MAGNCCNITPNVIGSNQAGASALAQSNQLNANAMGQQGQMKPAAGTSGGGGGVSHAMVGPSSSHHMHQVPLNLTLKGVMNSVGSGRVPNSGASQNPSSANAMQAAAAAAAAGEMHCGASSNLPGSSNGKQQHSSLFRKPQNVHILPPTHSSIRNLTYHQLSNKGSHCNATATFGNANGALPTKQ